MNWTDTTSTEVSTEAAYTFIVNADMALTANFEAITYSVTVSVNDTAMGGVTGIPEVPVMEGTELTLIANANEHYQFVNWTDTTGTEVSTEAAYTFTVNADMALTANFEAITYTVTVDVNDTAMGSVTGGGTYESGSTITIIATPNEGYRFVIWSDSVTTPSREILLTSDTAFKAYFSPANVGIGSTEVVANDIVIRPNPTAGDAYISVGQSSTVTVIDLHGRTVMAPMQVDNTVRIQQGTLPKGIYFVSVSNERGTAVRKLVIE